MTQLNADAKYYHVDRVLGEDYYQASWHLNSSTGNLIFSLSGNAPFKGAVSLVRAAALLKAQGYDQVQFRLAGVSQDSIVGKHISRIIKRVNLQTQITLLGRLNPSEVIQEMLRARLFVLPSHLDNSPNSLAEAMTVGMPCIASNAGGIPSMLKDKFEGLLYKHTDISDLTKKILQLLGDPDLACSLGTQARQTAILRHDPEKIAQDTVKVYQNVLLMAGKSAEVEVSQADFKS